MIDSHLRKGQEQDRQISDEVRDDQGRFGGKGVSTLIPYFLERRPMEVDFCLTAE